MTVNAMREHERARIDERNKAAQEAWEEAQQAAREKWSPINAKHEAKAQAIDQELAANDLKIMNSLFSLLPMIRKRTELLQDHGAVRAEWIQAGKPFATYQIGKVSNKRPKGLLPKKIGRQWNDAQPRENLLVILEWARAVADAGLPGPMKNAEELIAWNQGNIFEPPKKEESPVVSSYINAGMDSDDDKSRYLEGQALLQAAKGK